MSATQNNKVVSKNTVSYWLRSVIKRAYALFHRDPPPRPRAYENRALANSLLFSRNFFVEQVVQAGVWRRHNTFTRQYLREMALVDEEVYRLGPVVAAQRVL